MNDFSSKVNSFPLCIEALKWLIISTHCVCVGSDCNGKYLTCNFCVIVSNCITDWLLNLKVSGLSCIPSFFFIILKYLLITFQVA